MKRSLAVASAALDRIRAALADTGNGVEDVESLEGDLDLVVDVVSLVRDTLFPAALGQEGGRS